MGVTIPDCSCRDNQEDQLLSNLCEKTGSQWTMQYPWSKDARLLPNNRMQAEKLLFARERQLMKTPSLAKSYDNQIQEMINSQFTRKLSIDEIENYTGPVFYLPHHGVLKDSKSTPIRVVFNSSVVFHGHSLNDYWEKGPDLYNDLLGVLLRFRENNVALVGDISKMYYRIRLTEKDQHVHRFLWRDMDTHKQPDTYAMSVLTFGDKPAPAMAMTVLRKTAEERQHDLPEAANTICRNSYMDDICDSTNNIFEAKQLANEINEILTGGGFTIKQWIFSKESENKEIMKMDENEEKVLGVLWRPNSDELLIKTNISTDNVVFTKRKILSEISKIFDPLGLAAATVVKAKIMFQTLWERKLTWDDCLPDEDQRLWRRIFKDLFDLQNVCCPRSIAPIQRNRDPRYFVYFLMLLKLLSELVHMRAGN